MGLHPRCPPPHSRQAEEALELLDCLNLPHPVLETPWRAVRSSAESLVVEYAATLFAAVCDPSPEGSPPRPRGPGGFLGLCRRCRVCPPKGGQDGDGDGDGPGGRGGAKGGSRGGARDGAVPVRGESYETEDDEDARSPRAEQSSSTDSEGQGEGAGGAVELTAR